MVSFSKLKELSFLIYGLGLSGQSVVKFFKKNNIKNFKVWDDKQKKLFKDKRTIRFQFDMWHGNGYLDKAIDLLDEKDREDFRLYTRNNVSFSRGNVFVCKSKEILDSYFYSIFNWLEK